MTKSDTRNKASGKVVLIEFIMFFTYAFFAVNWIVGSTLTPQIMEYFKIEGFSSATFMSNAITIAKIIGNFLAAGLINKLYPKKSIALGSFLIVLGNVIAIFSPTYLVMIIGRFVMGFGGALYVVYFSPVVINYFDANSRPAVNAINSVAYNIGGVLALLIVGPVIRYFKTWQMSMAFFTAISLIFFVLWIIFGEDFEINSDKKESAKIYKMSDSLKDKFNYIFAFTYSGLLTFYIVLLNIFPISGTTVIDSKTLSTLTAVGGIIGTVLAIRLSKVYFKRLPVMRICGLLMTLSGLIMFVTKNGLVSSVSALLIGIFMFLPMTSLVMIPQELPDMTPGKLANIMGLFWAISYMIETVLYYIIGIIIESKGYKLGLYVSLICSLTFFAGSFILPETGRDKK